MIFWVNMRCAEETHDQCLWNKRTETASLVRLQNWSCIWRQRRLKQPVRRSLKFRPLVFPFDLSISLAATIWILKWSVLILGILNHFLIQVAKYVFCSFHKTSGKYGSAFMLFLAILNNASGSQVAAEANPCGLWLLTTGWSMESSSKSQPTMLYLISTTVQPFVGWRFGPTICTTRKPPLRYALVVTPLQSVSTSARKYVSWNIFENVSNCHDIKHACSVNSTVNTFLNMIFEIVSKWHGVRHTS